MMVKRAEQSDQKKTNLKATIEHDKNQNKNSWASARNHALIK